MSESGDKGLALVRQIAALFKHHKIVSGARNPTSVLKMLSYELKPAF